MKNPRFSIICPAFNHERYGGWFIDSVLAQTVSDWELVIVDDCSSDNTAKIIKSYTDKRINFIQHKINGGINAFDYKLICDSAPSLKHEVAKRQYRAIKSIYKNKSKLYKQLSDKYTKYVSVAQSNGDVFIYNLLKWNDLSLLQKIKTVFMWKKIK